MTKEQANKIGLAANHLDVEVDIVDEYGKWAACFEDEWIDSYTEACIALIDAFNDDRFWI